jgi:hypothetical protein
MSDTWPCFVCGDQVPNLYVNCPNCNPMAKHLDPLRECQHGINLNQLCPDCETNALPHQLEQEAIQCAILDEPYWAQLMRDAARELRGRK